MDFKEERWVYVVDDDEGIRLALGSLLKSVGLWVATFDSTQAFLEANRPEVPSCLLLDVRLKGESGLAFQRRAQAWNMQIPIVIVTGHADVPMTITAMKAGASDFLTKPVREQDLLDAVHHALTADAKRLQHLKRSREFRDRYESLTPREKEILLCVIAGQLNKQIAGQLNLSEVTVKIHRSAAMRKLGIKSLVDLVREAQGLRLLPGYA
ncbi:response regulator transcription factor [Paraburkholderia jirisanensis]